MLYRTMLPLCQANTTSNLRSDFEKLGTINLAGYPSFYKDPHASELKF